MDLFIRFNGGCSLAEFEAANCIGYHIDLLKIGFVVVISTFITYLLNLLTMKELKPTTVAVLFISNLYLPRYSLLV
jgi:hypothetical protein